MIKIALISLAFALNVSVGLCGEVYVERDASGEPVALVHNGPSDDLVAFMKDRDHVSLLQTVKTVRLLQHHVTANEIQCLSVLKSLTHLELGDHPDQVSIEAEALSQLSVLATIECLSVYGNGEMNNFDWLDSLPKLRSLTLSSDRLYSKDVFQRIGRLRNLADLSIRCSFPITDFEWLRAMAQLEQLDLHAERVNTADFSAFSKLTKLTSLAVSGHIMSNRDLFELARHVGDRLEFLSIYVEGDCTIESFARFSRLKKLVAQYFCDTVSRQRVVNTNLVLDIPESPKEDRHTP